MDRHFLSSFLRYKNPLNAEDLYRLGPSYETKGLAIRFEKYWNLELVTSSVNKSRPKLWKVLFRLLGRPWLTVGILRFIGDVALAVSTLLIGRIINFISETQSSFPPPPVYLGFLYVVILFSLQLIATVAVNYYFLVTMTIGLKVRTSLIGAVFRKVLKMDGVARKDFHSGKVMNIISTDVSRLDTISGYLHYLWSAPLLIIIIVGLLINALGVAALGGVAVLICLIPIQSKIVSSIQVLRGKNVKITDSRVRKTEEVLQGIRVLKFFTWEGPFLANIDALRVKEMSVIKNGK